MPARIRSLDVPQFRPVALPDTFLAMPRVAIIQGHPDPAGNRFCHALADADAEGAALAGHEVSRIEVARIDFPILRTQKDFETHQLPAVLVPAHDAIVAAQHSLSTPAGGNVAGSDEGRGGRLI